MTCCALCGTPKVLPHRFLLKQLWDELTDAQYLRVHVDVSLRHLFVTTWKPGPKGSNGFFFARLRFLAARLLTTT
jgi:hypothetical protein